jgi:hypothetical protein
VRTTYAHAVEARVLVTCTSVLLVAVACGAPAASGPQRTASDEVASDEVASDEVASDEVASDEVTSDEVTSDEVASGGDEAREDSSELLACESLLDFRACRDSGRCVWQGACRAPLSECELLWPEPVFDRGDPCERLRPGCAWSTSARRCVPFVAVPACPATLAEASALSVQCDHSGQVALECRYGATRCGCERTAYCGGAPPPPELEHPAAAFACIPPIDARGCPTSPIRDGARCRADPRVDCETCMTSAACVNGRWRVRQLPPRP